MSDAAAPAPTPVILVVEDEATTRAALLSTLRRRSWRVEAAGDGAAGLARAREIRPDLIVSDYAMPGMDGFELCRQVKADPALAGSLFIILSGMSERGLAARGLEQGVDDVVRKPLDAEELLARASAMLRLKARHDRLRADKAALQSLHGELGRSFDQLLQLLVHLIDLGRPGAADRGLRVAALARTLAQQLEVPEKLTAEMEIAARLLEIGALVSGEHLAAPEERLDPLLRRWTVVSRTVLNEVDRLTDVAQLVEAVSEHWDGTGFPGHFQKGQIPLRARILRVAADFTALSEQMATAAAINRVALHSGTWYDPIVVQHLQQAVGHDDADPVPRPRRRFVPVGELAPGMVLCDELRTASGAMLLAPGATITPGILSVILRRHVNDPVLEGPWVALAAQ